MPKPPVVIHHEAVARAVRGAEEAEENAKREAARAARIIRWSLVSLVVILIISAWLYRSVTSHAGTLLSVAAAVVLLLLAAPTADSAREKRKGRRPEMLVVWRRRRRSDEEQYRTYWDGTDDFTPDGADAAMRRAVARVNAQEHAVQDAVVMLAGAWGVFIWGFVTLATPSLVAVVLLALLLGALFTVGR